MKDDSFTLTMEDLRNAWKPRGIEPAHPPIIHESRAVGNSEFAKLVRKYVAMGKILLARPIQDEQCQD